MRRKKPRTYGYMEFGGDMFLTNKRTGEIILTKDQFNRLKRGRKL